MTDNEARDQARGVILVLRVRREIDDKTAMLRLIGAGFTPKKAKQILQDQDAACAPDVFEVDPETGEQRPYQAPIWEPLGGPE